MNEDDLLTAVREYPEEDAPRLAYADWLEERGDPRGEFIRVQVRLHHLLNDRQNVPPRERKQLESRQRELLAAHRKQWVAPLMALGAIEDKYMLGGTIRFRRGFVDELKIDAADFLDRAEELFHIDAGLRCVWLVNTSKVLEPLAASPQFARLSAVKLNSNHLGVNGVRKLFRAAKTRGLRSLGLDRNELGNSGLKMLAKWRWPVLKELDLGVNGIENDGITEFAKSSTLNGLTSLSLWGSAVSQEPLSRLVNAPSLTQLQTLTLAHCRFNQDHAAAIADGKSLTELKALNLAGNPIGPVGLRAVLKSQELSQLKALDLSACIPGGVPQSALSSGRILMRLHELRLAGNAVDDRTIARLASAHWLEELRRLDLPAGYPTERITDLGIKELAQSPIMRNLQSLNLARCQVSNEGAFALVQSETLSSLEKVRLPGERLSRAARKALRVRFGSGLHLE